jgi:ATP-dependent helicase/DNAse subunit B
MTMAATNVDAIDNLARAIAQAELATMKFSGPAWEAFQARMVGSAHRKGLLRAFLEYEVQNTTQYAPSHFELSFGRAKPAGCDLASTDTPVDLDLGGGSRILLAGRVDRVDIDPDGKFIIVDYKTGDIYGPSDVKAGNSLQVQLYMQAVQKIIPNSQGVGGIFYQVKSEAELEYSTIVVDKSNVAPLRKAIGGKDCLDQPISELVSVTNAKVAMMLSDMRQGIYHPALLKKNCKKAYCDYKHVCRFDPLRVMDMEGE